MIHRSRELFSQKQKHLNGPEVIKENLYISLNTFPLKFKHLTFFLLVQNSLFLCIYIYIYVCAGVCVYISLRILSQVSMSLKILQIVVLSAIVLHHTNVQ